MKGVLRECKQSFTKFFIIFGGKERSSVLCSLSVNKDSRIFHKNVILKFLWKNSSKCEYKHNLTIFLAMIGFLNNHPVCKYKRATEMNWKGLLVGTSRVGNFAVLPRSWYISILKVAMIPRSVTNLTLQNRSPKHPGTEKYLWPLPDQICKLYVWIWMFAPRSSLTILFIFLSWLHHYQQVTLPVMVFRENILRICAFSLYKNRYSCPRLNLRGFKHDLQYSYVLTSCVTDELIIYTHMRRAMIFYYHLLTWLNVKFKK